MVAASLVYGLAHGLRWKSWTEGVVLMGAIKNDRVARYVEAIESPGFMDEVVQRMCGVDGEVRGLPQVCGELDLPYGKVLLWIFEDAGRYQAYLQACEVAGTLLAGEVVGIADTEPGMTDKGTVDSGEVANRKFRVDTRFRMAAAFAPRQFGKVESAAAGGVVGVDVGLIGVAADLLRLVVARSAETQPRVVEGHTLDNGDNVDNGDL